MKSNNTTATPSTELQKIIADLPFDPAAEAEFQGLMLVEEILKLMKQQGVKRKELAKRMGVGPSRVTAMLNGSSNFKLETLIRASHALGGSYHHAICPPEMKCKWTFYHESETHEAFTANLREIKKANSKFAITNSEQAPDDDAKAA
ncbi:MAG: helix-turn-helix domain-containing protein [Akkermansiaceae bacterium]